MDFIRQNLHFLLSVRRRAGTQARFAAEDGRCLHFLTFNAEKRTAHAFRRARSANLSKTPAFEERKREFFRNLDKTKRK